MFSQIQITKENLKLLKRKTVLRKKLLVKSLGLEDDKALLGLVSSENELRNIESIKKARKLTREENLKLLAELNRNLETNIVTEISEDSELEEDLNIRDEKEGPKNDYNLHFVETGYRPQNFIRDPGLHERFEEYPKLKELIKLKDELIAKTNVPQRPLYLKSPLVSQNNGAYPLFDEIGSEFDVILIEPPLHEYRSNGVHFNKYFSWDEIKAIDVGSVAAARSFVFLWCGSADGLDKGRECLKSWGFRRCEEHCLMGIKGTVRRSVDNTFIHSNIDIDLIISEEPEYGNSDKPQEIFHIIEHFCLGRRRLYLFGRDNTVRPGWVTVGPDLHGSNFDKEQYKNLFDTNGSTNLTGSSERIELLRPKTPPIKTKQQQQPQHQSQVNMMNLEQNQIFPVLNNSNENMNVNFLNFGSQSSSSFAQLQQTQHQADMTSADSSGQEVQTYFY